MDHEERIKELLNVPRMFNMSLAESQQQRTGLVKLIREHFGEDFVMAEIGSYSGGSTEMFALFCKKVFAIDCWADNDNLLQEGNTVEAAVSNLSEAERIFDEKMRAYPNVVKVRKLSTVAFSDFADGSLDAIYIDGNHVYNNVCKDITLWFPKIRDGGTIAGHDYYENIKLAVNNTLGAPLSVYEDCSWVFKKDGSKKYPFMAEGWHV